MKSNKMAKMNNIKKIGAEGQASGKDSPITKSQLKILHRYRKDRERSTNTCFCRTLLGDICDSLVENYCVGGGNIPNPLFRVHHVAVI